MNSEMPDTQRSQQLMEEAEQTLRAIQYGTVDAFVVEESEGHRVYTLEGSDLPYSTLVEKMQQGAAMLQEMLAPSGQTRMHQIIGGDLIVRHSARIPKSDVIDLDGRRILEIVGTKGPLIASARPSETSTWKTTTR